MARKEPEGGYKDALQLLMEHTQGNGEQLNMQVRLPRARSVPFPSPSGGSMLIFWGQKERAGGSLPLPMQ